MSVPMVIKDIGSDGMNFLGERIPGHFGHGHIRDHQIIEI